MTVRDEQAAAADEPERAGAGPAVDALVVPAPPAPVAESDPGAASQWTLIGRRLRRHRLAVAALFLLAAFYVLAAFAEFFAPYPSRWHDLARTYCPPQVPRLSLAHGLYVPYMRRNVDPITLKISYSEDPARPVPLGFFVRGEPYRLCGLIPSRTHFFGVRNPAAFPHATFFLFGTDRYGQDVCSRIIFGSRISLSVGLIAIAVTFLLGITIGGVSGYVGGRTDTVIQRLIEIVNSFPQIPLWMALGAVLPADWSPLSTYFAITIVLSLLGWTSLARVVRGKIISLREEDYAVAARLVGASPGRILFRHLLPGVASHIIVVLTLSVPAMILGETSLSFLGLGLRPPIVSWGVMLQDSLSIQTVENYPWILIPVVFIVVTVLSFNFLGDGLRDAADPYSTP